MLLLVGVERDDEGEVSSFIPLDHDLTLDRYTADRLRFCGYWGLRIYHGVPVSTRSDVPKTPYRAVKTP